MAGLSHPELEKTITFHNHSIILFTNKWTTIKFTAFSPERSACRIIKYAYVIAQFGKTHANSLCTGAKNKNVLMTEINIAMVVAIVAVILNVKKLICSNN